MGTAAWLTPAQASTARSVLRTLMSAHEGIEGCAFMTRDGRVAASVLGPGTDPDRFAAMCAALIALATRAVLEAERGEFQQLIIEGRAGPMLITRAGEHGVLAVSAKAECPLGRLMLDARAASRSLASVFFAGPGE